jgi:ABC-type branched-subunit amino acid transport system substrate-binding protein
MRARRLLVGLVVALVAALFAAACSNAGSNKTSSSTPDSSGGPATTATAADLQKKVPITANGVTDSEIDVASVVAKTNNPTGASYGPLADGIKAYFQMVNDKGGIYGRKLVLKYDHDDQFAQNRQVVQQTLAQDKPFAIFIANSLFTSAPVLDQAKQLSFIWNINPEFAGHPTIFANTPAICFTCASHTWPYTAKQMKATKVGVLAYGIAQQSKDCAAGIKNSFAAYPTAKVEFFDDTLAYAQQLKAQVTAMKQKGIQLVLTCFDLNESFTLGKEMQTQGMNAVQQLPNGYDANFISKNAAIMEGDVVTLQFVALENSPRIPAVDDLYKYTSEIKVPVTELTAYGWILADEFYQGLVGAGPNFSQAAVVSALNRMKDFTANGFVPPIDWTTGHIDPEKHPEALSSLDCSNAVIVKAGKFVPYLNTADKQWVCFNRDDKTVDNPQNLTFVK